MEIEFVFHVPDDFAETIQGIGDFNEYVHKIIIEDLKHKSQATQSSKWTKIAKEIKEMNMPEETGEHIRKTSKEFKEKFGFI